MKSIIGVVIIRFPGSAEGTVNSDHYGAFDALAEKLTAVFVNAGDASGGMICVCRTAAGTVKARPAVAAFTVSINVAGGKLALHGGIGHAVPDIAEAELFLAHELMAGVKIAPRCDCHILGPRAAP